jgi:hypothetical protein
MRCYLCAALSFVALAVPASATRAAENAEPIKGRIQDVRPSDRQLVLTTETGKQLTLQLDDRSRLELNGQQASLDQLKKGMRVKVIFESRDGQNRLVSLTSAPVSAEELQKKIHDTLEAARSYSYQHKDEYRQKLQSVLEEVNEHMGQLQHQAAQAGAAAKQQYAQQIEQLRRLRDKAQAQLERVKSATPGAWEDLKAGASAAFEDLRRAFEKAGERFK